MIIPSKIRKNQSFSLYLLITFLFLILNQGCGIYSFSGSSIPSHLKTVAIPLFKNNTAQFGISQSLTDGVIEALTQDNTLKIASPRNTDAVLNGTITNIREQAGQYNQDEVASDFKIYITIKISFEDKLKKKILWEETWTEWGEYESDINEGFTQAAEKLSERILNRMVSGW